MKMNFRMLVVPALMMLGNSAIAGASAAAPECANANPDSVTDIQNCLARSADMQASLQQASVSSTICGQTKEMISRAKKASMSKEDIRVPSCDTVANALTQLNGVRPLWAECTHYDGSQSALDRCTASYLQGKKQNTVSDCSTFRMYIVGAIAGASDTKFNVVNDGPSCEMISKSLASQGTRMTNLECLDYRPNDQRHMEQCLKPTLSSLPSRSAPPSCDDLRRYYRANVTSLMVDPAQIQSFAIPTCPMIESAAKNVLATQGAVANEPTSAAPPPGQAPAASPSVYPSAQAPGQGANVPAVPTNSRSPVVQPSNGNASYNNSSHSSYPTETKQQERERRDAERAAKVQNKVDTINQVMGAVGVGGSAVAPGQSSAPADYETAVQGVESDAQRKAREAQQKVDSAAQTVNAVKGIFDAFGVTK